MIAQIGPRPSTVVLREIVLGLRNGNAGELQEASWLLLPCSRRTGRGRGVEKCGVFDIGTRFVWQIRVWRRGLRGGGGRGGAGFEKHVIGAGVLAVVAGFVAMEDVEGAGLVAKGAEGLGGASGWLAGGVGLVDFRSKTLLFNTPDAHEAPAGDSHILNQGSLIGGEGLEFGFDGSEEDGEGSGVFACEDDGLGEDAVAECVVGRAAFAFEGFRSSGLRPICAGDADTSMRAHFA
jgi:hypothetical protein